MTKIIRLRGTEPKLYELVAPLVMNPAVIKYNNRYPFKTDDSFVWFVAVKDECVVGFMPVEVKGKVMTINNYYVDPSLEAKLFPQLLKTVVRKLDDAEVLHAVVMVRHAGYFEAEGFKNLKNWKLYLKMERP